MGIGGGMRGECMLSISEGWADGAMILCVLSLSHFLIWALWKCRKFMQGFDFLIKLLSL